MVLNGFQVNRFPCNQENMQYGLFGHKYSSSQSMVNEPQVLILLLFFGQKLSDASTTNADNCLDYVLCIYQGTRLITHLPFHAEQ